MVVTIVLSYICVPDVVTLLHALGLLLAASPFFDQYQGIENGVVNLPTYEQYELP